MAKNKYDRTCSICGDHYNYCNRNCQEYAGMPKWMSAYCSKTCMDLYDVCAGYKYGWFDPQVMAAKLATINYKDKFDKISDWMKQMIREMEALNSNASAVSDVLEDPDEKISEDVIEGKDEVINEEANISEKTEENKKSEKIQQTQHQKIQYKNSKQKNIQMNKK